MKKVKTFIASLMIILATAVLSACSCSGDKGNPDVTPVACQNISISSDFAGATKSDETGYLKITCQLSEEFAITYKLGPDNTTQTQVDWSFSENNIVGCKNRYDFKDGVYSFSRGTEQTIKFVANKAGSTTIRFSPHGTDKFVLADITVTTPKATWPTFLAPSGIDYNPTTGEVTWNAVTKYKKPNGEITDAPSKSGQVNSLSGYIVSWTNLETSEKGSSNLIVSTRYGLPNDALQRGQSYAVSVVAKGDNLVVNDSAPSDILRFHQLATVTELKNENGIISFKSPRFAEHNYVYYDKDSNSRFIDRVSNGSETCSFNYKDTFEKGTSDLYKYNVYVVSYPTDFDAREAGKNYVVKSGIRYYPSVSSAEDGQQLEIQKLYAPTISFDHNIATDKNQFTLKPSAGVKGVTFNLSVDANQPHLSSILSWRTTNTVYNDDLKVVYKYQIFKGKTGARVPLSDQEFEVTESNKFDTSKLRDIYPDAYADEYTFKVFASGDKATTIDSVVSEFKFKMLGASADAGIVEGVLEVTQPNNAQAANIQGVDFYFLKKTTGNEYSSDDYRFAYVNVNNDTGDYILRGASIDLVALKLNPGEYDIFARFVGINRGTAGDAQNAAANTATGAWFQVTGTTSFPSIKVAKQVTTGAELSSAGQLKFTDVYDTTKGGVKYKIKIDIAGTSQIKEIITSNEIVKNGKVTVDLSSELSSVKYSDIANATITIICCGYDGEAFIDSQPSSPIKFTRRQDPKAITLEDYKLSFGAIDTILYRISLIDKFDSENTKTYQAEWRATSANSVYDLNSTTKITYNEKTNVTFAEIIADLVGKGRSSFDFTVQAIGGSNSSLDSNVKSASFNCTNQPQAVTIKKVNTNTEEDPVWQNMLSWTMPSGMDLSGQKFEINLVAGEGQNRVSTSITPDDNALRVITLEDGTGKEYGYDITSMLKEAKFKNKVVTINILQKLSNAFYGKVSGNTYGIALNEVSMSSAITEGTNTPVIKFKALNSVEGVAYHMTVVETGKTVKITDATSGADYSKSLGDLEISASGTYTIKLKTVLNSASISQSTPFGIESDETSISIKVISSQITVVADGNNASFVSIHSNAKYELQYKLPTDTDWISIVSDLSGDEGQVVKYDLTQVSSIAGYTGGTLDVRVVPTLDYASTGCLLTSDEAQTNSLTKLQVTELSSQNGKIAYKINDTFLVSTGEDGTTYNYKIALYANGKEMSADTYIVDFANNEITITSSTYLGNYTYTAYVRANGYLTSNVSNELALTMVSTTEDLTKTGDYITWSIDANATSYVLMIGKNSESITAQTIEISNVQLDEAGSVISATVKVEKIIDEKTKTFAEDTSIAKFDNGKLMYKFTNTLLGETADAGDYWVKVKAYTTKQNFLTGIESNPITITKLSNNVQIAVDGVFKLSGYTLAGSQSPQEMHYEIYKHNSLNIDKTEADASLTLVKFEANATNFEITFQSKNGEEFATIGTPIQITYDSTNHKALKLGESGFEENPDLVVSTDSGKDYISISGALIPTNTEDATQNTVRAIVSFSQMVYENNVAYENIATDITSNTYSIDLNKLESPNITADGNYSIRVKFVGNNANIVDSDYKNSDNNYSRLLATKVNTQSGVLVWSPVENASKYIVSITGAGMNVTAPTNPDSGETEGEGQDISTQADLQIGTLTFEVADKTTLTEDDVKAQNSGNSFVIGESYTIKIMSSAEGSLASVWSGEFKFKKLTAPTNLVIKASTSSVTYDEIDNSDPENPVTTPVTINVGDPILTWQDPNTTANQKLHYLYNMGDKDVIIYNSDSGTLVGQLLGNNRPKDSYKIKMKVQGNTTIGTDSEGLLTSDYSDTKSVEYVNETQSVSFEQGNFKWNEVKGAYAYKLTFKQDSIIVYTTYTKSCGYSFKNTEFEGCGYYTVEINAITDPTMAIVSSIPPENGNLNTKDIFKAPNVTEIFVRDGKVAWSIETSALEKLIAKESVKTALDTALESIEGTTKQKAIGYLKQKINNQADAVDAADEILYPFFVARLSLNNQETVITATGVELCSLVDKTQGEDKYQEYESNDNGSYLVFTYNMATMPGISNADDVVETKTYKSGKYSIKVSPVGNAINSEVVSSVDGKYSTTFEAWKPQTPSVPSVDGKNNKMDEGNILWQLVPTAENGYHNTYQLIAQENENLISRNVDIADGTGVVGTTDHVYSGALTTIFADGADETQKVSVNTNYTMNLRVIGTPSSKTLGTGQKAYLNSDVYNYGEEYMNILANISLQVSSNQITWEPSNASSSTKLMIYGPFDYAPDANDKTTWKDKTSYEEALKDWKNSISSLWTSIADKTNEKHGENYAKYYHEYNFDAITVEGDDGVPVETTRKTSYTLSDNDKFGAGSYIIRKQEIGNGKGIIDTKLYKDSNGNDLLFVNGESPLEIEKMGVIATKLDKTMSVNNVWANNGKFIWSPVERANAYRITLIEYKDGEVSRDDYHTLVSYADSLSADKTYHEWDIPSIVSGTTTLFNDSLRRYAVRITATHVDNLNDTNASTSANYFDGETSESDSYQRTNIPVELTVKTEMDISYLQWNMGSVDAQIAKFAIHVSHNDTTTELDETSNRIASYNISNSTIFREAGRYIVSLRAIGNSDGTKYLNSSLSQEIIIIKLPKPKLTVEDGVFGWGSQITDITDNQITETDFKLEYDNGGIWETKKDYGFGEGTDALDPTVSKYPLFATIDKFENNYNLSQEYPAGKYRFSIRYSPKIASVDDTFVIASPTDTLTVNKLPEPNPQVSKISTADGITANRVEWAKVANATAYKARVLARAYDENNEEVEYALDVISTTHTQYFTITDQSDTVYLNIDDILGYLNVSYTSGATLKVYVQAIGTALYPVSESATGASNIYINSSFSEKCDISIPATPLSSQFDAKTGVLSWNLKDNTAGHNAQITMEYTVSNLTKSVFDYWTTTANSYGSTNITENPVANPTRAYAEITNRVFTYTFTGSDENARYTLRVTDIVLLSAQTDDNRNTFTPTSYQITSIGTDYRFKINIMVASTIANSGDLISGTYEHQKAENFDAFEYGDGSEDYRYAVNNYASLNSIRYFANRNFVVTENINVTKNWDMIETEFTGSIVGRQFQDDGGNNVYPTISTITPNININGNTHYIAFMRTNLGSISNLNLVVNILYSQPGAANVYVAGLAITNSGTIDNVNIESTTGIKVSYTGISNSMYVAGLVYENIDNATIKNSSVTVGKNDYIGDDINNIKNYNNGIYALCGGSQIVAQVAGIAGINKGIIADTYFSGDMTANYVAGIASNNSGTIRGCYSTGNAYITDINLTTGAQGKSIEFGGIAGTLSGNGNAKIINSYSTMAVTLSALSGTSVTAHIGGLYANLPNIWGGAEIINSYTAIKYTTTETTTNVQIQAYYFGVKTDSIRYQDCYYLVLSDSGQMNGTDGVGACANLAELRTALGALTYEGNLVYDVSETHPYPVLKK